MNPAAYLKTLRTLRRRHGKAGTRGANLTAPQVVARWNGAYTVGTLANWRAKKQSRGPAFIKVAKSILYPIEAVELFEAQMLSIIGEGVR